ncbi:MAG: hypothetical protein JNK05_09760 [Myxococcales bacterium]|nr:hypothetical protein [Myxococcales bacterium]
MTRHKVRANLLAIRSLAAFVVLASGTIARAASAQSCRVGECASAPASTPSTPPPSGERPPPPDEASIPFLTVHGVVGFVSRSFESSTAGRLDHQFLITAGAQASVHLDISRYVVPYAEGYAHFTNGSAFAGSAGAIIGWRTWVRASLVGIQSTTARSGNYQVTTTTTTTTWWGDARYPLVIGAQVGAGVFGLHQGTAQPFRSRPPMTVSGRFGPRIELGPTLWGQHHVNALVTVNPLTGIFGLRGNVWMRLPINVFWISVGLDYDVQFNNAEIGGYDFMVGGFLGFAFARRP